MRSSEKLHRTSIFLYAGDLDRLAELYQHRKPSEVVRVLIRRHIEAVEEQLKERKLDV